MFEVKNLVLRNNSDHAAFNPRVYLESNTKILNDMIPYNKL